jgi:hypothetical protein
MHGSDVELHPTDTEAVVTAERAIIRLRAQIAAEKSTPRDGDAAPQEFAHECYVTLVQMASIVNRTKRTLERLVKKQDFPLPDVDGGGGKPNEWRWAVVRPVLESEYGRKLPEVFPGDRFAR